MRRQNTRRRPDSPKLTCILGEPEIRLRAWLAGNPGWDAWREDGIWHAASGPAVVTSRDFATFVTTLEELGAGRVAPAADHLAALRPVDPGDLPDIIA